MYAHNEFTYNTNIITNILPYIFHAIYLGDINKTSKNTNQMEDRHPSVNQVI